MCVTAKVLSKSVRVDIVFDRLVCRVILSFLSLYASNVICVWYTNRHLLTRSVWVVNSGTIFFNELSSIGGSRGWSLG